MDGLEFGMPSESTGGAPEELSEDAKQRFAAAAAAMQQIRREEKKSKKRDDQLAKAIIQFLNDDKHAHLFVLISRLVARDCPSVFILAILSLISEECTGIVQEYLQEVAQTTAEATVDSSTNLTRDGELDAKSNRALVVWVTRMQMVLALEPEKIFVRLMVDEGNVDGSVLQLTTAVVQDFFKLHKKDAATDKVLPLTTNILHTVMEPFIAKGRQAYREAKVREEAGAEGE